MDLSSFVKTLPKSMSFPRPYFNHSIEFKKPTSVEERTQVLEKVGLNVFFFPSELVSGCDLLSDSGTTTMTNEQWAALQRGDEAYGSNRGYFLLMHKIREIFGESFFNSPELNRPNAFLFHQGRPCEDALFSCLKNTGANLVIPSNGHFDTTQANIEANMIEARNLFSKKLIAGGQDHFKGNMNVATLKELIADTSKKIPLVFLTITNNTGGGQPVSMANIAQVSKVCRDKAIPLFFDACRFAENAWFIKQYEQEYAQQSIRSIVKEMFSYCDGFTISFKKDGLVNIGGGLFLRDGGLFTKKYPALSSELMDYQIIKEGHPTYGGMSGREIMALVEGLGTVVEEQYLTYRIRQVQEFGEKMAKAKVPVITPIGGHAVYIDVNQFFEGTSIRPQDFGGISLTALLLAAYGHRACELGYFAFGSVDPKTGKDVFPKINLVRFAVPRLRYEEQDLTCVADAVISLHQRRDTIPPVRVTYGKELSLRHFKARFAFG